MDVNFVTQKCVARYDVEVFGVGRLALIAYERPCLMRCRLRLRFAEAFACFASFTRVS